MSTIGKASLQADENGLVTLQCDRCKSRFKVDCTYLNDELQEDICCPICGISESLNTFWPEEIAEEAIKIAYVEAEKIFANAFKDFNSEYIKITTNPISEVDSDLTFKNRDYGMHHIIINCCKKPMALMPLDIISGFYCPYCGRIAK